MPPDAIPDMPVIRDLLDAIAARDARIATLEAEIAVLEHRSWLREGCAGAGDDRPDPTWRIPS